MQAVPSGPVKFDSTVHDFGTVSKREDVLSCDFVFENTSDRAIVVDYAVASCSCTELKWPLEPVPAGGRGTISVFYHRERYADSFDKSLTVHFGSGLKPVVLRISGNFVDDAVSLHKDFPFDRGMVGLQAEPFDFGVVHPGKPAYKTVTFANFKEDDSVNLVLEPHSPCIGFSNSSHGIPAFSRWNVTCTLVPDSLSFGRQDYSVTPVVDGVRLEDIHFKALVLEDFSMLSSAEKNRGAVFRVLGEVHHFGIIRPGATASARIVVENISNAPLVIRSVAADRSGVVFDFPEQIPARSKSGIDISIDPESLDLGDNRIIISLFTDSPLMPFAEVELLGCVKN